MIENNLYHQSDSNITDNSIDNLCSFNNYLEVLVNTKFEELTEETFNCGFENSRSKDILHKLDTLFLDIKSINEETNHSNLVLIITRLRVVNKFYWAYLTDFLETDKIGVQKVFPLLSHNNILVKKNMLFLITEINNNKLRITENKFISDNIHKICRCSKYPETQEQAFACLLSFFNFSINNVCLNELIEYYFVGIEDYSFVETHFQNSLKLFSSLFQSQHFSINIYMYKDQISDMFEFLLQIYSKFKEQSIKQGIFLLSQVIINVTGLDPSTFLIKFINCHDLENWKKLIIDEFQIGN